MTSFHDLLNRARQEAKTPLEKGKFFEQLMKDFLANDSRYAPQFEKVWTFKEWAAMQDQHQNDTGIDLVAQRIHEERFCAIQCKFYDEKTPISRADIDKFFTASGTKQFTSRLIMETTDREWGKNAENALKDQTIPVQRIGYAILESSNIDWSQYIPKQPVMKDKNILRPHQTEALEAVKKGLESGDRGKLIMACGTGKTFTSLKIAESLAGINKYVLFVVPSLSLMSQTIAEWTAQSSIPLRAFAVCSDSNVGKRKSDDVADIPIHDLEYPATTKADTLASKARMAHNNTMTVIFSTYHSIEIISHAQKQHGLWDFDFIICDEAHRTTGATFLDKKESFFVKIHDNNFITGSKRLYMTATPRIYAATTKDKAKEQDIHLACMKNREQYGETLFTLSFGSAVQQQLLTDYKVIVLALDTNTIPEAIQKKYANNETEIAVDDLTKIVGCYRALTKASVEFKNDPQPMKRALAFCRKITLSKEIKKIFTEIIDAVPPDPNLPVPKTPLVCELDHVDGTENTSQRNTKISWLTEDTPENTCRILSNVRCLSEGVDVPTLDALIFFHPRKSQIDVVQSVGRVMRRAKDKKMGYIILPVCIPSNIDPVEALHNNKNFQVIWQTLNSLRSHDPRINQTLAKLKTGEDVSDWIEIIVQCSTLPKQKTSPSLGIGGGSQGDQGDDNDQKEVPVDVQLSLDLASEEFKAAIIAKMVEKCGNRGYWDDWSESVARIVDDRITHINETLNDKNSLAYEAFSAFVRQLQNDLNEGITESEVIEMLAQHTVTQPIFNTLFQDHSFTKNNPVSKSMQKVLDTFDKKNFEIQQAELKNLYIHIQNQVNDIQYPANKHKILIQLYDNFFKKAFPKMTQRLGIVYTPIPVVDFIIHSINDVLKSEFNTTLGDKGVHILDPFTGTGTFITRLLQSGLISNDQLAYKYANEIHANEIVLLAYYIASINIEWVYHDIMNIKDGDYKAFPGICLADTFQQFEKEDLVTVMEQPENSTRRIRQNKLNINVIFGNPPYSVGQKSENDNNANSVYPKLRQRIGNTYALHSTANLKNSLYDSYILALRWASDRLAGNDKTGSGILAFVTSAGFLDSISADGLRKCLAEEFSSIYVFHLRGNLRTFNALSKKEGGSIFGNHCRSPIAIVLFVRNPAAKEHGRIFMHDIGDFLTTDQKLDTIDTLKSLHGISEMHGWVPLQPDDYHDWIKHRNSTFNNFIVLGNKKHTPSNPALFHDYSCGIMTNRDAWTYNASKIHLSNNIQQMIAFYNNEISRYKTACHDLSKDHPPIKDFLNRDATQISWSSSLLFHAARQQKISFTKENIVSGMYRPFTKQGVYFDRMLNDRVSQMPRIFPDATKKNRVIIITGRGGKNNFSTLMVDTLPNRDFMEKGFCFPLYLYETVDSTGPRSQKSLFSENPPENEIRLQRTDGITDSGFAHFADAYPQETFTKEDLFYYIYGVLHSTDYRTRYENNLGKEIARIPRVKTFRDFCTFRQAGRTLADLHVNYESAALYPVTFAKGKQYMDELCPKDFYVQKMKFHKQDNKKDKSTVIYNNKITLKDIPLEAYTYEINGKSALEWVMDRQSVRTDKDSGIVNDANDWGTETLGNARYPLELFQQVITISLETLKIVKALPPLDIVNDSE